MPSWHGARVPKADADGACLALARHGHSPTAPSHLFTEPLSESGLWLVGFSSLISILSKEQNQQMTFPTPLGRLLGLFSCQGIPCGFVKLWMCAAPVPCTLLPASLCPQHCLQPGSSVFEVPCFKGLSPVIGIRVTFPTHFYIPKGSSPI